MLNSAAKQYYITIYQYFRHLKLYPKRHIQTTRKLSLVEAYHRRSGDFYLHVYCLEIF